MSGWISLHRKLIDNPIYSNAGMLKLWVHCLLKASHAEHDLLVGNQVIKLQPGQFVTGRNALASEFNKGAKKEDMVSPITLWRWLNLFEKLEMLNIKKTTKYSVVTVINWSMYQPNEQQMNNKRTTNEQQMNTNNNGNKGNNDNNKNPPKQKLVYEETSPPYKLADYLYKRILINNPNHKKPDLQKWADEFRKVIEIDKRDLHEISKLIKWVQEDDFESVNVLSPTKLRKRYDQLLIKMNRSENKQSPNQHQELTPMYKPIQLNMNAGEE